MFKMLDILACPGCKRYYVLKEAQNRKPQEKSLLPLLLECGHSACEECLVREADKIKHYTCAICEASTNFPTGSQGVMDLKLSSYVMQQLQSKKPPKKQRIAKKQSPQQTEPANVAVATGGNKSDLCVECAIRDAVWYCESCDVNFCRSCWNNLHKKLKYMRKHTKKSIGSEEKITVVNGPVQILCNVHSNREVEFFCENCDKLACSYCAVMGPHKGHSLIAASSEKDRSEEFDGDVEKLKEALISSQAVYKNLRTSQTTISRYLSQVQKKHGTLKYSVQMGFLKLHGLLEKRENEVMKEFDMAYNDELVHVKTMLDDIKMNSKKLLCLIEDSKRAADGKDQTNSKFLLEKKLLSFEDAPVHAVSATFPDEPDGTISIDLSTSFDDQINNFGIVKLRKDLGYKLVAGNDLPPDYIPPVVESQTDLDEAATISSIARDNCDAVSISSVSERSVNGNAPLSWAQQVENENEEEASLSKHEVCQSPLILGANDDIPVVVTHIKSPSEFMVRRLEDSKALYDLESLIHRYVKSRSREQLDLDSIQPNQIYVSEYDANKRWYRAKVLSRPSERTRKKIKVLFIDYGNQGLVSCKQLCSIKDAKILQPPAMALPCRLYDLMPIDKSWSANACKMFYKLTAEITLNMRIMEKDGNTFVIDLFQSPIIPITHDKNISFRDSLVFLGLGRYVTSPQETVDVGIAPRSLENEEFPAADEGECVQLCFINDLTSFHVQKCAKFKQLRQMMNSMHTLYSSRSGNVLKVLCPRKGAMCAARFQDNRWYRCEILECLENFAVHIKYVDYGNEDTVCSWDLRKLPDEHLELPAQALHCALADIIPKDVIGTFPRDSSEYFEEIAGNKVLLLSVAELRDRKGFVTLHGYKPKYDVNLNALFVQNDFAASSGPGSVQEEEDMTDVFPDAPPLSFEPSLRTKMQQSRRMRRKKPAKPITDDLEAAEPSESDDGSIEQNVSSQSASSSTEPKKAKFVPIQLTHLESPSCLYIKLKPEPGSFEDECSKLMADLQKEYNTVEESGRINWKEGDYCCFKCPEDQLWYRGSVIEVIEAETAKVFHIDYGRTSIVPIQDVTHMLEKFKLIDSSCLKCYLPNIIPAGDGKKWSAVTCEFLFEFLKTHEDQIYLKRLNNIETKDDAVAINLQVKEVIPGTALDGTKRFYMDVSKKLLDEGLALPEHMKADENMSSHSRDQEPQNTEVTSPTIEAMSELEKAQEDMSDWLPSTPPTKSNYKCIPTYVGFDGAVYFYDDAAGSRDLQIITDALQLRYGESVPEASDLYWLPGQICIAKFHADNKWYRGKVIKINEEKGIEVKFVDYGNVELVDKNDLRKKVILTELPIQSTACDLYALRPVSEDGKWTEKALDFIHKTIVEKLCTASMHPPTISKRLSVELVIDPNFSLDKLLIEAGVAKRYFEHEEEEQNYEDYLKQFEQIEDGETFGYPAAHVPTVDELLMCSISEMKSPNEISIQVFPESKTETSKSQYDKFMALMSEMEKEAMFYQPLRNPRVGGICCANYTHDNKWYRGTVLEERKDGYLVKYVDYGNEELLTLDRLRSLPKELVDMPIHAIPCQLYQVTHEGEKWSPEITTQMLDLLFNTENLFYARVKVTNPQLKVDLLIKDATGNYELAYQSLIDDGKIIMVREKRISETM